MKLAAAKGVEYYLEKGEATTPSGYHWHYDKRKKWYCLQRENTKQKRC